MTWGHADEAGKATRWLATRGLPGPELLADLLARQDGDDHLLHAPVAIDDRWSAPGGWLCPVTTGAALCDRAREVSTGRGIELGPTAHPALLAFHVATAAALTGTRLELGWLDAGLISGPEGSALEGTDAALVAAEVDWVRCRPTDRPVRPTRPIQGGWDVDEQQWHRLDLLAHRTFAPATEQSRLTGAGAGTIDD